MSASQQILNTLKFNIAQLKQKIAVTPPAPFSLWTAWGPSRRVLEVECAALEELEQAIALSQGNDVVHPFWGRCSPSNPHDVARYVGLLKTYQAQAKAGMCCLLQPYLGAVNELVDMLSTPRAA